MPRNSQYSRRLNTRVSTVLAVAPLAFGIAPAAYAQNSNNTTTLEGLKVNGGNGSGAITVIGSLKYNW